MASQDRMSVEALLFASGKAMPEEQIALFTGIDKKKIKRTLKELKEDYDKRETSLKIFEDNKTWRMMVRDDYIPLVKKIISNAELSRATMETLAVIAFKYPKIQQSEVIHIRGTTAYDQIKELSELGFITRQKEGRSFTIRLTEKFFEYFDVEGEKDIKEFFKDIDVPKPSEKQKQLGDLEVVDVSPEALAKKKNGELGLEVVDVNEKTEGQEGEEPGQLSLQDELVAKKEINQEEENSFLSKIESQIDELSKRNDDHDEDELLKRPEPLEETGEQVKGESKEQVEQEEGVNSKTNEEETSSNETSETQENDSEEQASEEATQNLEKKEDSEENRKENEKEE